MNMQKKKQQQQKTKKKQQKKQQKKTNLTGKVSGTPDLERFQNGCSDDL